MAATNLFLIVAAVSLAFCKVLFAVCFKDSGALEALSVKFLTACLAAEYLLAKSLRYLLQ